jgi:branched-chain amino acid transport system permease protein
MITFIQALILGILAGAVYGLFSTGLSLSFGVLRLVNFAHGDFVMVGMYLAYVAGHFWGLPVGAIIPLSIIPSALVAYFIYVVFFQGTGRSAEHDQLIVSLGISIILENAALDIFGDTARSLNPLTISSFTFSGVYIPKAELLAFVLSLVLVAAIDIILTRTKFGRSVRAVVANRTVAELAGVRSSRVFTLTFMISIVLAIIAGIVIVGYLPATPDAGSNFVLIGFISVLLGGTGDLRGTFAAAVIVGLTESLVSIYWSPSVQDVVAYGLFVVIAMTRPRGLFGRGIGAIA